MLIGLDAPDFNLGLERRLRARGLRTAHVVSPTIWAWRPGRVRGIARSVDLMLCLFPFEPRHYEGHGVKAHYIGHPLADELDDATSPQAARTALGIEHDGAVVALLPGSRGGELKYLAEPFAKTAALLHARVPGIRFISPIAKPALEPLLRAAIQAYAPDTRWTLLQGQSRDAMRAADAVLLASGTATLECLLLGRPMAVAYRTSRITGWLMLDLGLLKTPYVSLPNLLSAEPVVEEFLQDAATPEAMADEIEALLRDAQRRERQRQQFDAVRISLRRDAAAQAAEAIAELLNNAV